MNAQIIVACVSAVRSRPLTDLDPSNKYCGTSISNEFSSLTRVRVGAVIKISTLD